MFRNCGEEVLGDLWRYHIRRNVWTFIKIDYNRNAYASLKAPFPRYGGAGCYIALSSAEEIVAVDLEEYERRYLYIYGGFSYFCQTACHDIWRYEIPYAPIAMAPDGRWKNAGNHWEQLQEDSSYGPGKRWKTAIVPYQRKKDEYNDREENYIYLFGGIRIMNTEETLLLSPEQLRDTTSYVFMSDLWRYELLSNQWEEVEVYGISEITRNLFLWNGTRVTMDVETKDRLAEDKNRTKIE